MASSPVIMVQFLAIAFLYSLLVSASVPTHSKCRFSPLYSQDDILRNSTPYAWDVFYWEGHFHQNNVGYNTANGMSYDGTLLNSTTGLATQKHDFSASSKESLQIMVYAHAIAGDPRAARFVYPQAPKDAPEIAAAIMSLKLKAYLNFNQTYPGYGGFLPWFLSNDTNLQPTSDWVNRVPALDNGYEVGVFLPPFQHTHTGRELIWAVYAAVHVLNSSNRTEFRQLGQSWQAWLDYAKVNAASVGGEMFCCFARTFHLRPNRLMPNSSSIMAPAASAPSPTSTTNPSYRTQEVRTTAARACRPRYLTTHTKASSSPGGSTSSAVSPRRTRPICGLSNAHSWLQ